MNLYSKVAILVGCVAIACILLSFYVPLNLVILACLAGMALPAFLIIALSIRHGVIVEVNVPIDFSVTPGPRLRKQGIHSGEDFRELVLLPALRKATAMGADLKVVLDGSRGYGYGFLEEAFGGLIRGKACTAKELADRLVIVSEEDPTYKTTIDQIIAQAGVA